MDVMGNRISSVLIANRGEIACRIIKTLRRMGITSCAVYSEVDHNSLHVRMADHAVCIGPAPSAESYLSIEKIIEAALPWGADAIHPGYGFLSENAGLVKACDDAGIIFIGPSANSIEQMGLKDHAKALMEAAAVPVVPGYHGDNQDPLHLAAEADTVGYPVLIKARAGGGGKGMRLIHHASEFEDALKSAQREAMASFADDHVLIEKFVASPRHIEVQIFGDQFGNVVHLFERDCSLQRRHQKVIEEAPAPGITAAMRDAMGTAAIKAAQSVNYVGAGTVEFIVDASQGLDGKGFYFMEMNTRLQVEHPVTEAITGVDLVEWQIKIASGEPLPLTQQQIKLQGHAMEARAYAEDTENGFLPAIGKLDYFRLDNEARIDTGVGEGDEITPFYDPMIAKIIVAGENRIQAIGKLRRALGNSFIAGCTTNLGFLHRLVSLPIFINGNVETGIIASHADDLSASADIPAPVLSAAGCYFAGLLHAKIESQFLNWRQWCPPQFDFELNHGSHLVAISIIAGSQNNNGEIHASIKQGEDWNQLSVRRSDSLLTLIIDHHQYVVHFYANKNVVTIFYGNDCYRFEQPDPLLQNADGGENSNQIVAPMPGQVIEISTAVNDVVEAGQTLIVLEAMKMEHSLVAPRSGTIAAIHPAVGDQVIANKPLIELVEN